MKLHHFIISILLVLTFGACSKNYSYSSTTVLHDAWKIVSSKDVKDGGAKISMTGYNDSLWISTTVPTTIMHALIKDGKYPDIYKGNNLDLVDKTQFESSWWYRKEFAIEDLKGNYFLNLLGINYRANIFLNGNKIASADTLETAFRQFKLDISSDVHEGTNALALELIPPKDNELTIGFVDWNPEPVDKNLGIWREVQLINTGDLILDGALLKTKLDTVTLKNADISITTWMKNKGSEKDAKINIEFEVVKLAKTIHFKENESKKIEINSEDFEQLKLKNPRVWWPNGLGKPELYHFKMQVIYNGKVSDEKQFRFGIRDVQQYLNKEGHKAFKINGKKIIIKGAGWVDDLFLGDTDQKVKDQLAYAQHMNLNTIRLEGFWGRNSTLFDTADELGLLVMAGWSCHWEWEGYCHRKESDFMCINSPEEIRKHALGYRDQVKWLRNHPSIFLWVYGSDKLPSPELEQKLNELVMAEDGTRPILNSCKGNDFHTDFWNISQISGPSGVKMLGPYGYVTPNYWYENNKLGGAFGFNTETGPGPQVPPLESIKRMIPKDKLWPVNDAWDFHCGRHEFENLDRFIHAFNNRYGESNSAEDFAKYCQLSNYEAIRPMYEAFAVNKFNSTGVVQWMLNSAWPEMFWQLYDWYLNPNAAFYGTKHACETLNLIYNYKDQNIYVSNELFDEQPGLSAKINILNEHSQIVFDTIVSLTAPKNSSVKILEFPKLEKLSKLYFIDLKLMDEKGTEITSNFYWLSTKKDVCDYPKSEWFITPNKEFADFTDIRKMERASVNYSYKIEEDSRFYYLKVDLDNDSDKLAFFINMNIQNQSTGKSILPVFWSDNYVSLLPGEKRQYQAKFRKNKITKSQIKFKLSGLNLKN